MYPLLLYQLVLRCYTYLATGNRNNNGTMYPLLLYQLVLHCDLATGSRKYYPRSQKGICNNLEGPWRRKPQSQRVLAAFVPA
jgi:hypothetical protein